MDHEDEWAEAVARRYSRRSGIRRIYCYPNGLRGDDAHLKLEFVIWGRVLFTVRLWKIEPLL